MVRISNNHWIFWIVQPKLLCTAHSLSLKKIPMLCYGGHPFLRYLKSDIKLITSFIKVCLFDYIDRICSFFIVSNHISFIALLKKCIFMWWPLIVKAKFVIKYKMLYSNYKLLLWSKRTVTLLENTLIKLSVIWSFKNNVKNFFFIQEMEMTAKRHRRWYLFLKNPLKHFASMFDWHPMIALLIVAHIIRSFKAVPYRIIMVTTTCFMSPIDNAYPKQHLTWQN